MPVSSTIMMIEYEPDFPEVSVSISIKLIIYGNVTFSMIQNEIGNNSRYVKLFV